MEAAQGSITCKQFVELASDYLEGEAGAREPAAREHLEACPGCRTYLEQLRGTVATMRSMERAAMSEEDKVELLELFRAYRRA